jgi:hypothetical protein
LSKVTLSTIGSRYGSIDALNDNFDAIEDAFDNTLSLDGSTPNEMAAPLNMGGNRVINVSNAINNTDAPNLQQVNAIISNASSGLIAQRREKQTASAAQTVVNLTGLSYFPNSNNLSVYVNGVKYYVGDAYTETSPTQVTFVEPLTEGDRLEFVTNEAVANQVGDAANVSYTPAGTGATQTNVESKLREFVSVKDFGAVGDGVTDDTAAVQAAYNYCASIGGGNILWPRATYKVNGTILFTSNTKTDLGGSTIIGNNQTLFETGYRSGSTVLTTVGTSDSNFTQAVFGATFGNGKIQSTSLAFRLVKFLWHCHIHEIEITTGKFIDGYICFYSGYSDLLYSGTTNFFGRFSPTANFTTGSSTIDVADSDATSLANGMVFASYSVPLGTTITNIGAAGSGGVGRTSVTLSNNAIRTATAGDQYSGYCATADTVGMFKFSGNCSNTVFEKCTAARQWLAFDLAGVDGATFTSCDISFGAYGFKFTGQNRGITFTGTYTEQIFQWLFDCSAANYASIDVTIGRLYLVAGVLTAGTTGKVKGRLCIQNQTSTDDVNAGGFTPYALASSTSLDVTSPNADMVIIGGYRTIKLQNPDVKSQFFGEYGVSFANVAIADSTTLDYYKEGTWTPVIAGSSSSGTATYSANSGKYTRIGDLCFVDFVVTWTGHTGTGQLLIQGWPEPMKSGVRLDVLYVTISTITKQKQFLQSFSWSPDSTRLWESDSTAAPTIVNMNAAGTIAVAAFYKIV